MRGSDPRLHAYVQCRYTDENVDERCTGEAVDRYGDILLCLRHLALAKEMIDRGMREYEQRGGPLAGGLS